MRIAVIATTRNPLCQPFAGGQEAQTAALLRGLRQEGHTVRLYARDGTEPALCDELAAYPVPPVLSRISELDLHLPDCHGADLLVQLRALPALADTPAIAVTADAAPDLLATTSFVDVWTKPLRVARVLQGVDRWAGAPTRQ